MFDCILTYPFKNTLVPNKGRPFQSVFMSECRCVYTFLILLSPHSIGMYKVYYSILISFIIKSIPLPSFFLPFLFFFVFFFFLDVTVNRKKNLFCYIKDKEISTCIISITVGLRPSIFYHHHLVQDKEQLSQCFIPNIH